MVWTARELITESWYLTGIVSPQAQDVTGFQISQGLRLLNRLLAYKQVQTDLVPYYTYNTSYSTVAGQEVYFIENCAEIQSVTFNLSNVRFNMQNKSAFDYYTEMRVNNIRSLPYEYTFQREKGGTNLYLYFLPQDVYQLNIYGKFFLMSATLETDMEETFDASYIEYLRWYLAKYMLLEYNMSIPDGIRQQLRELESQLQYLSPPSPTVNKQSTLQNNHTTGWMFYNFYSGFWP